MAIKITNPDVQSLPENEELAGGSFELYASGSNERRFASTDASLANAAPFQNSLDAKGWPVKALWVDSDSGLDVLFRDRSSNALYRDSLSNSLPVLSPDFYSAKVLAQVAAGEEPGTPPAAIADLDADLDGTTATLTWTANGGTISVYRRNVNINGKFSLIASGIAGDATSFEDAGLLPGSTYEWTVRASNTDGFSPASNVSTVTTSGATVRPAAITDLTVSSITSSQATLTWTPNGGSIDLYRRNVTDLTPMVKVASGISGAASTTTDTGLKEGNLYEWQVIASSDAGSSGPSNIAFGKTTDDAPAYPYLQPLQDKRGVWVENEGAWSPVSDEGFYTISGTGFGTKTSTAFEFDPADYAVGPITEIDGLKMSNTGYASITDEVNYFGQPMLKWDYAQATIDDGEGESSGPGQFPKIYRELSGSRFARLSCPLFFTTNAYDNSPIWKFGRLSNGETDPYGDPNRMSMQYTGASSPSTVSGDSNGTITPPQNWTTNVVDDGTGGQDGADPNNRLGDAMHFYEMAGDIGALDAANADIVERWNGQVEQHYTGFTFKTSANPNDFTFAMTPLCGLDGKSDVEMYMGRTIVDESLASVYLTDNPDLTSATKIWEQVITTYSDTQVKAAKKRGPFEVGETAYLVMRDVTGEVVYTSSAFTVTEDTE